MSASQAVIAFVPLELSELGEGEFYCAEGPLLKDFTWSSVGLWGVSCCVLTSLAKVSRKSCPRVPFAVYP